MLISAFSDAQVKGKIIQDDDRIDYVNAHIHFLELTDKPPYIHNLVEFNYRTTKI
jgi:hypothetical protein